MTTKRESWERMKVANREAKLNMPQHKDQSSVPIWAQHPRQHPTPPHRWGKRRTAQFSHVRLFAIPWTIARQASLSITNSWSPPKPISIESVMPSSHLILCHPLLLLPSIFPSIRIFSNESALRMRWPKYWSFSFNISPPNEHPGLISFRMDWLDLLAVQGTLKSPATPQALRQFVCFFFLIMEILPTLCGKFVEQQINFVIISQSPDSVNSVQVTACQTWETWGEWSRWSRCTREPSEAIF